MMKKKLDGRPKTSGFGEAIQGEGGSRAAEKGEEQTNSNRHHQKQSLQYLFQVRTVSSLLHIFCIPMKKLKTYKVDFIFPGAMCFYHRDNRFYLGGGHIHLKCFAHFKAILANGELTEF